MKKLVILFLALIFSFPTFAYNWIPYCPDTIHATNICFGLGFSAGLICSPDGLYLYEDDMEWHFYTFGGLPVIEAANYSPNKILLIMGDGTYSDGIYTFDLQTHQFEVIEWLYKPSFIRYYDHSNVYYAGQREGGLHLSADGLEWNNLSYFDTIPCHAIDFYEEHVVVSEGTYEIDNLHLSGDGGNTWHGSVNGGWFTEIEFCYSGDLFAVFQGLSNSAGIYKSEDFGSYWEPLNWEFFITALGYDAIGNVFVGWDNGYGIAMLDPDTTYPDFVFLNEGLPNTYVNEVKLNPAMSVIAIFVCTGGGVYYCNDYTVGIKESSDDQEIKIIPNPVSQGQILHIQIPNHLKVVSCMLMSVDGKVIYSCVPDNNVNKIDLPGLPAGLYYCLFEGKDRKWSKKLVIY